MGRNDNATWWEAMKRTTRARPYCISAFAGQAKGQGRGQGTAGYDKSSIHRCAGPWIVARHICVRVCVCVCVRGWRHIIDRGRPVWVCRWVRKALCFRERHSWCLHWRLPCTPPSPRPEPLALRSYVCVWGGGRSFRSCRSCRPLFHFPGNGAQHFSCRAALDLRLPWCVGVSDGDSGFPSSVTRTPQCPMSRSNLLRPASASLLPCGSPPPLQPSGWRTQHGGVNLQLSPCPQQITRVLLASGVTSFGALVWLLLLGSPPTPPLRVGGWVRESALPSQTCVCMRRCRCTVGSVEIAFRYRGWGPRLMTARVSAPLEVSTNKLTVPVASVCALMKPDLKTGGRRIGGVGRMGHCARERTSWVLGPSPGVGAIVNAELPPSLPTPFPLAQLQAKFQSPSQKVRRVSVVENSRVRGGGCTGRARGAGKWRTPQTCCWGLERRPKNREFVIQNIKIRSIKLQICAVTPMQPQQWDFSSTERSGQPLPRMRHGNPFGALNGRVRFVPLNSSLDIDKRKKAPPKPTARTMRSNRGPAVGQARGCARGVP